MSGLETTEMWRHFFAGMRMENAPSWNLLWHLYAMSDNALTAAQLAERMHIPREGVIRLMNAMGVDAAMQTGLSPVPDRNDGWQIFFSRRPNPNGEWVYSINEMFLPILGSFRLHK